jgi:hypothetical protein
MIFPINFLKGIPNKDFLLEDNTVASHLFYFKQERQDGDLEQSINWEDDKDAVIFTLNQKKEDGDLQFEEGAARIRLDDIDELNKRPTVNGVLSYERDALPENKYHGNLIIKRHVKPPQMKQIAAGIALAVSEVISH